MEIKEGKNKREDIISRLQKVEKFYIKNGSLDKLSRSYRNWLRYTTDEINAIPYWRNRLKEMGWQQNMSYNDRNIEYLRIKTHEYGRFPTIEEIPPRILKWIRKVMLNRQQHNYAVILRKMGCTLYEDEYKNQRRKVPKKKIITEVHPLIIKSRQIVESGRPYSKIVRLVLKRLKNHIK